jgi:periplasmic copper chaperone A
MESSGSLRGPLASRIDRMSDREKYQMREAAFRQTLAILLLMLLAAAAHAGEVARSGPLEVDTPWARATIGTARPAVPYVTFRNTGDQLDELVDISMPAAARPEVHAMTEADGVMKMRPAGPLELPPGAEVHLEPGGMHIMLMGLRQPLEEGESIPITFTFRQAGDIIVSAPITSLTARTPPE